MHITAAWPLLHITSADDCFLLFPYCQTEELAEQLERAVEDIDHMKVRLCSHTPLRHAHEHTVIFLQVVNCYHMARKRKHNLFEIVEARHHQEDEGGSSSG